MAFAAIAFGKNLMTARVVELAAEPRERGWSSQDEAAQWLEALGLLEPQVAVEIRATEADRQLARWARMVAGAAAVELLKPEAGGDAGRSSLAGPT